jgi:hypothetical protein
MLINLAICAALGSGIMGGPLFAFSNCVMRALAHQRQASGIRRMQGITIYILNPLFLGVTDNLMFRKRREFVNDWVGLICCITFNRDVASSASATTSSALFAMCRPVVLGERTSAKSSCRPSFRWFSGLPIAPVAPAIRTCIPVVGHRELKGFSRVSTPLLAPGQNHLAVPPGWPMWSPAAER